MNTLRNLGTMLQKQSLLTRNEESCGVVKETSRKVKAFILGYKAVIACYAAVTDTALELAETLLKSDELSNKLELSIKGHVANIIDDIGQGLCSLGENQALNEKVEKTISAFKDVEKILEKSQAEDKAT